MGLTVINTAREKNTKLESISIEINQKLNTERKKTEKNKTSVSCGNTQSGPTTY